MGEPCIGHRLFSHAEMGDGVGDVGGVPGHDRGDAGLQRRASYRCGRRACCGSAGTAALPRRRRGQPPRGSRGCAPYPSHGSLLWELSAGSGASSCIGCGRSLYACMLQRAHTEADGSAPCKGDHIHDDRCSDRHCPHSQRGGCGLGFDFPRLPGEQRARPGRGADADDARRPLRRRGRRRVLAHHRGLTDRGVHLPRRRQCRRHAIRLCRDGAGL